MNIAISQAKKALLREEVPVGAVIVDNLGNVVSMAHNMIETNHDPTAHAEIIAIRLACTKLSSTRLWNCSLYVTLEPCVMCAQAISNSRISTIYYGAMDLKGGGVDNGPRIFSSVNCHHKPEIYSNIMEDQSKELLQSFFKNLRNKKRK